MFKPINIKIWPRVVSLGRNFQWKREIVKSEEKEGIKIIKGTEADKTVPNGWHMFSFQSSS
jgi:hypothetical protein